MSRVKKRRFLQIALAFYIKKFRRPLSSDKNEVFRKKGAGLNYNFFYFGEDQKKCVKLHQEYENFMEILIKTCEIADVGLGHVDAPG